MRRGEHKRQFLQRSGGYRLIMMAVLAGSILLACQKPLADELLDGDEEAPWLEEEELIGEELLVDQEEPDREEDQDSDLILDEGRKLVREGELLDKVLQEEAESEAERERQEEQERRRQQQIWEEQQAFLGTADPESLQQFLDELHETENPTGSDGELILGSYIRNRMEEMGYIVSEQSFHEGFLNEQMIDVPGLNVIAERGANSETPSEDILVVCAHYDSMTDPDPDDPLANDKSGAAVLLECARMLSDKESDRDICFIFLSGEEDGNFGSERMAEYLMEDSGLGGRIRGVICIGTAGYASAQGDDLNVLPYQILQGEEENEPAERLKAFWQRRSDVESETEEPLSVEENETEDDEGFGLEIQTEEEPAPASNPPTRDEGCLQKFADAGFVTTGVWQDTTAVEEGGKLTCSGESLTFLTDVLAQTLYSYMKSTGYPAG